MTVAAPPEPRWATVAEAAAYTRMSPRTIRRWISQERLPAERVGPRRLRVDLNEVDKLRKPIQHTEQELAELPPKNRLAATPTPAYSVLAWKGTQATPTRLGYADPIDALTGAVEYLKAGYQVRLSDTCVEWYGHQPIPDPVFLSAAGANGQAAAFTGPPRIGGA